MVRQRSDASLLAPAHLMAVLYAEDPPMREAGMPGGLPLSLLSPDDMDFGVYAAAASG